MGKPYIRISIYRPPYGKLDYGTTFKKSGGYPISSKFSHKRFSHQHDYNCSADSVVGSNLSNSKSLQRQISHYQVRIEISLNKTRQFSALIRIVAISTDSRLLSRMSNRSESKRSTGVRFRTDENQEGKDERSPAANQQFLPTFNDDDDFEPEPASKKPAAKSAGKRKLETQAEEWEMLEAEEKSAEEYEQQYGAAPAAGLPCFDFSFSNFWSGILGG